MHIRFRNTWKSSMDVLLVVYEDSATAQGRKEARQHLANMAAVADIGAGAIELMKEMREIGELSPAMKGKLDLFMTKIGHDAIARIPDEIMDKLKEHALEYFLKVPSYEDRIEATILELKAEFQELGNVAEGTIENVVFKALRESGVCEDPGVWESLLDDRQARMGPVLPMASYIQEFHLGFEVEEFDRVEILENPDVYLRRNWYIEAHTQSGTKLIADFSEYVSAMDAARRLSCAIGVNVCDTVKADVISELNDMDIREAYGAWAAKHCEEGCSGSEFTEKLTDRWEELRMVGKQMISWIGDAAQVVRNFETENEITLAPSA